MVLLSQRPLSFLFETEFICQKTEHLLVDNFHPEFLYATEKNSLNF